MPTHAVVWIGTPRATTERVYLEPADGVLDFTFADDGTRIDSFHSEEFAAASEAVIEAQGASTPAEARRWEAALERLVGPRPC